MIGIRLDGKKEASLLDGVIRRPDPPAKVRIPLTLTLSPQGRGKGEGILPPVPCVGIGTHVRTGEVIAQPEDARSAALHASISGEVTAIGRFPDPLHGESEAIEIQSDHRDEKIPGMGYERTGWQNLPSAELLEIFRDSGLVELEGEMTPLHVKAGRALLEKTQTLILNACEPEPYVTSGYALAMAHPVEILKGAEILRRAACAGRVVIAVEENKLELVELLRSKIYFLKWKEFEVKPLPPLYPTPLPFSSATHAATAFAVYEAVAFQKPLYERVVTVGGECVAQPKNVWARTGTSFGDLIKTCRGLLREPRKVLMGGPMKGLAQATLDVPVLKSTSAVLALPKETAKPEEIEPCIRCGRCVEACPVEISPVMITLAAERDLFDIAHEYGAESCIECGNCAYVCPAKRPMVELIRYGASPDLSRTPAPSGKTDVAEYLRYIRV